MKLLAVDPGIGTGLVLFDGKEYYGWEVNCTSLANYKQYLLGIMPDEIVYEDFKHRPSMMKAELYSKEVIGVTRLIAEENNIPIVATYLPAKCKAFWTTDKIKAIGLWKSNKQVMDAMRVMLTHRQMTDHVWFFEQTAIIRSVSRMGSPLPPSLIMQR